MLIESLKNFSENVGFGLCYDFSYWKADEGRCISKTFKDKHYTYAPLCMQDQLECSEGYFSEYCPNITDSKSCKVGTYFCNISKTCVPKGRFIVDYKIT